MTPTVTVAIPVLDEEAHLGATLEAVVAQTCPPAEILVVDGGSTDRTREIAVQYPGVRVLHNPRRIQAAALNVALHHASGDVVVRVDGHCVIAPDYVERCLSALEATGAAMVGGRMTPLGHGWLGRGIATAMSSKVGAGPARFHAGAGGWVDTVYLGAFRRGVALRVGGYDEDLATNEDAEFAVRMRPHGGVWLDDSIRSTYAPRSSLPALARQFHRYGQGRAATVGRHPASLSPRQLPAPLLVLGLLSPWRRKVAAVYGALVIARATHVAASDRGAGVSFALALPTMHVAWGTGFLREVPGILRSRR